MRGCYALLLVALLPDPASAQRVLHWVIRVSSLEDTISFATDVLGMQVLRHEENDEPCPLTCNGVFDTPWSKTMVGYGPEDAHYALELTYNYGIPSYEVGGGLQRFVIHMDGAAAALERAAAKGLAVNGSAVVGPDSYVYELLEDESYGSPGGQRREPFHAVVLKAADPAKAAGWYADLVGMEATATAGGGYAVGFAGAALADPSVPVSFIFEPTSDGAAPAIEQWEGRNAIALPAESIRKVNARLLAESPELIIHQMRELHEKLGTLFILIVRDVAGYEVCLVSIETFDPSVREATNYIGPDFEDRKARKAKVVGLQSLDKAREKMLEQMQASLSGGEEEEEEEDDDDDDDDDDKDEV